MKYSFPAVFRVDNEDANYVNVIFPDIAGAVTFGNGMDNARFMAKDLLIALEDEIKISKSSSLEQTMSNFPGEIVETVEVDI